jgi:penicillin-binding protein 2
VSRHTWRHPFRGNHRYPKPATSRRKAPRRPPRQPRLRPRKSVNVAALVAPPEEQASRPMLRLNVVGLVVVLLFGVLILRLWTLQVIDAHTYAAAVNANTVRIVSVPAPRGLIVDRNGTELVGNTPVQQVLLSRTEAIQDPSIIGKVAALVHSTPKAVQAALNDQQYSPYEPVPVMNNAPQDTVEFLQQHQSEYPGVTWDTVTQRSYPQGGGTATHMLGYVGGIQPNELAALKSKGYTQSSQVGQAGLESQYESYLKGRDGQEALEVSATGNVVGVVHRNAPTQGNTLVTNVDSNLQLAVQSALQNTILADRQTPDSVSGVLPAATGGAAIVLDPNNGQVLALASYPSYNLDEWVGGISTANYDAIKASGAENDLALQGLFAPGSTFKLFTAVAALTDNVISAGQYVNDTGVFNVPHCTEGCQFFDDQHVANGEVDMQSALTESDDYYFYNLGYQFYLQRLNPAIGPEGIQNIGKQFGLDSYTRIDLPNENVGRIDSPSIEQKLYHQNPKAFPYGNLWTVGDNIEMSFGQGGNVFTPIQLANAYATFANGGTLYQPQIAAGVVSPTGKVLKQFAPKVVGHVNLPPSITQPILAGLQGVVSDKSGTAYGTFMGTNPVFNYANYPIAGKTGTATAPHGEPTAWFVSFGPMPHPQYLVMAVVDQGGYGAQAAAPAVKQIWQYLETNPVAPVTFPSAQHQASATPPATHSPQGTPAPTTTTTTTTTAHG